MNEDIKESVFHMFSSITRRPNELDDNSSSHTKNNTRGPGLGLTFCKSMIEQLGGEIWFDSKHNEGSTFYIRFPVKIASKANIKDQDIIEKSTESVLIEKLERFRMRAQELKQSLDRDKRGGSNNSVSNSSMTHISTGGEMRKSRLDYISYSNPANGNKNSTQDIKKNRISGTSSPSGGSLHA